jgi:hypothetical protein
MTLNSLIADTCNRAPAGVVRTYLNAEHLAEFVTQATKATVASPSLSYADDGNANVSVS